MIAERILELALKNESREFFKTRHDAWTYKQLTEQIQKAVKYINLSTLESGEPLGLAFPNSWEFVILLLAAELTGHPAVLLGASLKPREITYHIQNSGIKKILASPRLSEFMGQAGGTKTESVFETVDSWSFENVKGFERFSAGDFLCQLTSGTNGLSKGVVRTGAAVLSEITAITEALEMTPDDTVLTIPPIHHSFGLIPGTLSALCAGSKLILADGFLPGEVTKTIETEKVSFLFAVPFMYHLINQLHFSPAPDLSTLRRCVTSGAPLPEDVAKAFRERFGKVISKIYGATETGVMCLNLNPVPETNSVGKPLKNRLIQIIDESGQPLTAGKTGEIRTKSIADARAYVYPSEMNETAFNDGWYSTGDFGSMDQEGFVYVSGRKNNIINVAGLKVDPAEVEAVINSIPGVQETVVVGIDTGAGGQVIKAVIVPAGIPVDKKLIIDVCRKNLSDFKTPRIIEFTDELPRSQTGKILRKCLQ